MGSKSNIEWTNSTWNPVRGCSRVSEGCRNCYAERVAHRFSGPGEAYEGLTVLGNDGPRWNGKIKFIEEHLEDPIRWKKPRMIFVNSMSDLFHEALDHKQIERVFNVMRDAPHHIYQVLTKRPQRMRQFIEWYIAQHALGDDFYILFKHVWLGVSVENQATANERIPILLFTPAAIRWISAEPLLGPIDLKNTYFKHFTDIKPGKLHWVVCGGESGPGARAMHPEWVRSIRDQCKSAGVPFFFKQWGEYWPVPVPPEERVCVVCGCSDRRPCHGGDDGPCYWMALETDVCNYCVNKVARLYRFPDGTPMLRVGKNAAGHLLDELEYFQYPEVKDAHR